MKIFCALLVVLFAACTSPRYIHNPVAVNNPVLTQKHDSRIGAYVSGGFTNTDSNYNKGFDLVAAYAISHHVAITGSYFSRRERNYYDELYISPFDTSLVSYHRSGWEAGAGYFTALSPEKHVFINIFGGVGNGSLQISEQGAVHSLSYARHYQSSPFKIYIQPGLNLVASFARFGVAYRFNFLRFKNIATDYSLDEEQQLRLDNLNKKTILFRELAFALQIPIPKADWLAVDAQLSFHTNNSYYRSRNANGSVGLSVDMHKLLRRP